MALPGSDMPLQRPDSRDCFQSFPLLSSLQCKALYFSMLKHGKTLLGAKYFPPSQSIQACPTGVLFSGGKKETKSYCLVNVQKLK